MIGARAAMAALLVAAAFGAVGLWGAGPATAASSCSTASTPARSRPPAGTRPVIFVHGWTGVASNLSATGKDLTARTGQRIAAYYFDYGRDSTTWAGSAVISDCLAKYIVAVAATYGGDGKVLVVAHSMGGLATLYAAAEAGVGDHIGGVVSLDTPYLGSPWGDTGVAGWWQGVQQFFGAKNLPAPGSDAQVCLAQHKDGASLPAACDHDLPGYLPTSVPLTQIAGSITIHRKIGPFHLYDIPLDSDGIVSVPSSHGYLNLRAKAQWPLGEKVSLPTDACAITSDSLTTAAVAAGWSHSAQGALAAAAAQVYTDSRALDGLRSGKFDPYVAAYLLAAYLAAPCSHSGVLTDGASLTEAAAALNADLDQLTPSTRTVVLAPVSREGRPAAGWRVTQYKGTSSPIDCGQFGDAYSSPSAVTGNIYYCSPTAAAADTCWPSVQPLQVLCLEDPWSGEVVAHEVSAPLIPVAASRSADPIGLELAGGERCRLRNGGSWDSPQAQPSYVGYYSCTHGFVWGPPGLRSGLNKTGRQWTVAFGDVAGPLKTVPVLAADYVTTAP